MRVALENAGINLNDMTDEALAPTLFDAII